jgi:hypothetical protein
VQSRRIAQVDQDNTISKYDRLYGSSKQAAMMTKPSTIKVIESVTGRSETFIVQTARHEDGDRIFIESVDEAGSVVRLALPFKVATAIASQNRSLTARRRSVASKIIAQARKDRGELPGFMRKK